MEPQIYWRGASNKQYGYWIAPLETEFRDAPGNFVIAKQTAPHKWAAIYIGETSSLKYGLSDSEKFKKAVDKGATHIHVHVGSISEHVRKVERIDMIAHYRQHCSEVRQNKLAQSV